MKKYLNRIRQLAKKFKEASFVQLLREENIEADALANVASVGEAMDKLSSSPIHAKHRSTRGTAS